MAVVLGDHQAAAPPPAQISLYAWAFEEGGPPLTRWTPFLDLPEKSGEAGPNVTETAGGEAVAGETEWWGRRAGSEGWRRGGERWAMASGMSGEFRIRESAERDGLVVAWRVGDGGGGEVP